MSNATNIQKRVKKFWTKNNVTNHHEFRTVSDSLDFLDWRNKCYLYYENLMPTNQANDKVVLDYGCGPGHDLVGFAINSNPKKLIAADVSASSITQAKNRLALHGKKIDIFELEADSIRIPIQDQSVDLIHSSGVLHHTENPMKILKEFRRIIKPDGTIQIMVYNYESIWVHLYVAYELMLNDGSLKNRALRRLGIKKYPKNLADAFRSSTDGTHCPISRFYKPSEFLLLLKQTQFSGQYKGASVSLWMEMNRLSKRFAAIADRRLPKESREFLYRLNFDKRGVPLYDGFSAGIGGCYEARPE